MEDDVTKCTDLELARMQIGILSAEVYNLYKLIEANVLLHETEGYGEADENLTAIWNEVVDEFESRDAKQIAEDKG